MYLVHLLINADGVIDEKERSGLKKVQILEHIPDSLFTEFELEIANKKEREIYQREWGSGFDIGEMKKGIHEATKWFCYSWIQLPYRIR